MKDAKFVNVVTPADAPAAALRALAAKLLEDTP